MPTSRPPYPVALRTELLQRVRAGETPEELAKRYEPSAQTIRNWLRDEEKHETKSADSGFSVADLERENRELRSQLEDANEIGGDLKKRGGLVRGGQSDAATAFEFVNENQATQTVSKMCEVLEVSRSG